MVEKRNCVIADRERTAGVLHLHIGFRVLLRGELPLRIARSGNGRRSLE